MSGDKKTEIKTFLKNIFRTRLEISGDTMERGSLDKIVDPEDVVRGNTTFYYTRSISADVMQAVTQKNQPILQVQQLTLTVGCDVPKKLWDEFQNDSGFLAVVYGKISDVADELVKLCAKKVDEWEVRAAKAKSENNEDGVEKADRGLESDLNKLIGGYQQVIVNIVNDAFNDKARIYGNYKRYKAKAAASLIAKTAGLALSIAALGTAATPAAPATIIPALIGIYSTAAAIGKQVGELMLSAEDVEREVVDRISTLEIRYKKPPKGVKKVGVVVAEGVQGFLESVTGGATALFIPSMKEIFARVANHGNKLDGLDVKLHDAGILLNTLIDGSEAAEEKLEEARKKLAEKINEGAKDSKIAQAEKSIVKAKEGIAKARGDVMAAILSMPDRIKRVDTGRQKNKQLLEALRTLDKKLGTMGESLVGPASIGGLLGSVAMIGAGYASPPTEHLEKITSSIATAASGLDILRDLTPDVWEKIVGK